MIVTNHVNWHRENLWPDRENTGNLKMQFEWVPCGNVMGKRLHSLCGPCKISDANITTNVLSYRALQRERQLNAQLRESLDEERGSKDDMSVRERAAIADLQAMLDLERSKLLDLQVSREIRDVL